ncbi:MAG: hypothetical protein JNN28_15510, partial [Saprospiraceae bacterium]|nr:hypothetical protein [Saprospiraceae bacterium]
MATQSGIPCDKLSQASKGNPPDRISVKGRNAWSTGHLDFVFCSCIYIWYNEKLPFYPYALYALDLGCA